MCDIIIYYPGGVPDEVPGAIRFKNWYVEKGTGVLSVVADVAEVVTTLTTVTGVPDAVAVGDVSLATIGSAAGGQTYYGQPHPNAPEMFIVGQDVLPAIADLGIGTGIKAIGWAGAMIGQPYLAVGGITVGYFADLGTSTAQGVYDFGRLTDTIPTYGGMGFYYLENDSQWIPRKACIIYYP